MNAIIIGAGIGGLTAGIALQKVGINVKVYEAAEALKTVGAGILLSSNALQVFDKLDVKQNIENVGYGIHEMRVIDADFNTISAVLNDYDSVCIHRAKLQAVLYEKLGTENIHLGKRLTQFKELDNGQVEVTFEDASIAVGDILIGADGVNSILRKTIFPTTKTRYSGQTCWRGIARIDFPKQYDHIFHEMWHPKGRFGIGQINENEAYWFAVQIAPQYGQDDPQTLQSFLLNLFGKFNPFIKKIIEHTDLEKVHRGDLSDLSPVNSAWHKGNICLIGDAAHATTPNMGQGACQAIEDGYALALALEKYAPKEAFQQFQVIRQKKVSNIVNTSWQIGKVAHWSNPIATTLRNGILRLTPTFLTKKELGKVSDISYLKNI